jgi:hypothetical protein
MLNSNQIHKEGKMKFSISITDEKNVTHEKSLQLNRVLDFLKGFLRPKFKIVFNTHKDSFRYSFECELPFIPQKGTKICFEYGEEKTPDSCTLEVTEVNYHIDDDYFGVALQNLDLTTNLNELIKHWEKNSQGS